MSDTWQTPDWFLERVRRMGPIALDPCAGATTDIGRVNFRGPDVDGASGLTATWQQGGLVFANPPYSSDNPALWTAKAAAEAAQGVESVALLPASTGAGWFFDHVFGAAQAVCWIRKRIRFIDPATGQPAGCGRFWSVAVYYGERVGLFAAAMSGLGVVGRLPNRRAT